jgi:hypothetical protein
LIHGEVGVNERKTFKDDSFKSEQIEEMKREAMIKYIKELSNAKKIEFNLESLSFFVVRSGKQNEILLSSSPSSSSSSSSLMLPSEHNLSESGNMLSVYLTNSNTKVILPPIFKKEGFISVALTHIFLF